MLMLLIYIYINIYKYKIKKLKYINKYSKISFPYYSIAIKPRCHNK